MFVEKFNVGDAVRCKTSGWLGVVEQRHANRNNGYAVRWTDTRGSRFTKPGDVSKHIGPLELETYRPRSED